MAGGAKVELQGFDELSRSLEAAGREVKSMPEANATAGEIVASAARTRAPRATGALAATVRAEPDRDGALVLAGGAAVDYSVMVEYGTRSMRAEPYIRPALAETHEKWVEAYANAIDDVLGKVHGA